MVARTKNTPLVGALVPAALVTVTAPLSAPLGLAALAFLAWCAATLAWTPFPALSLRMAGEFSPTLVAAYLLARLAPGRIPGFAAPLSSAMVVLAGLTIAIGLAAGLPLIIATFRLGRLGATSSVLILTVVGGLLTLHGHGPIALMHSTVGARAQFLQLYLAVAVVAVLLAVRFQ